MEAFDSTPAPNSTLNRFHETSAKVQRYKILLRRRWWFLLLTAAIAVCVQALRITGKATEYIAIGKVVVGLQINADKEQSVVNYTNLAEFYGTQVEILESGELKRRALDRVRSLHPEIKEIDVEVKVTQTRGSSILTIAAVGEEAKYTRIYLDALLDEYMAFRKEMIEKSLGTTINKVIEEVLSREKLVKDTKQTLETFLKNNDIVIFEGDRNQAASYLSKLKNDLNQYETEMKLMEKMGLDDYLKQKDRQNAAPASEGGEAKEAAAARPTDMARSSDAFGGLSRTELDYLKALSDKKLIEAERLQLLRIYKPEHPNVIELDEQLQKQLSLIDIHKEQSMDEWQRRLDSIKVKIAALNDEIKEWEVKARDANEKIVMHQSLKSDYERTAEDYQEWKRTLERLDASGVKSSDMVAIMERPSVAFEDEPELWLPLLMALVIGLAAGTIILLLFDRMDDRMNSFSEFQSLFPNEPILGQIPEQSSRGDVTLIRNNDDRHLYAEAFRNLRSSILFKNWKSGKPPKLIMVTSAVPNEGKTTTVANMAVTMALGGSRVLLADADLRRGGINELFKASATPGLSDVLNAKLHWRDAVQETGTKGLHILPRGEALDQTSELFLTPLSDEVLKEMGDEYDYVIFDSAPVLVADDTASFAPKLECVLFVVRMSSTMARLSAKALDLLYERQVNVAGVILNRSSTNLKEYTYYNYASYYSVNANKNKEIK
jgi:polysaccharide biosynthesis transport protein